jgi:hypothetical protein
MRKRSLNEMELMEEIYKLEKQATKFWLNKKFEKAIEKLEYIQKKHPRQNYTRQIESYKKEAKLYEAEEIEIKASSLENICKKGNALNLYKEHQNKHPEFKLHIKRLEKSIKQDQIQKSAKLKDRLYDQMNILLHENKLDQASKTYKNFKKENPNILSKLEEEQYKKTIIDNKTRIVNDLIFEINNSIEMDELDKVKLSSQKLSKLEPIIMYGQLKEIQYKIDKYLSLKEKYLLTDASTQFKNITKTSTSGVYSTKTIYS